jgi:hypothetical protein
MRLFKITIDTFMLQPRSGGIMIETIWQTRHAKPHSGVILVEAGKQTIYEPRSGDILVGKIDKNGVYLLMARRLI